MITRKELPIKFTLLPSKAWWLFLGILLLGIVAMLTWTKKSSLPLVTYLPSNTTFYYHWSEQGTYENLDISRLAIIDAQEPKDKITSLKNLMLDGFFSAQEIVWFKTASSNDDNYLLRLDSSKQITKWLAVNRQNYNYLLVEDNILLISADPWLPNHYKEQEKIAIVVNNLGSGVNIFWSKNEAPKFLQPLTAWLKLDTGLPNIYANISQQKDGQLDIHVWQPKLRQLINSSTTESWPNQATFPLGADLIFGFGDHNYDKWQALFSQNILQPLITNLPYYRLSAQKIEEQVLNNNFIYLANNNWLMVAKEDWQAKINDWVPNLSLKELRNKLPDGTVYTEYVSGQGAEIENLSYQAHNYWHLGELYGAQIGAYYYLTNNESVMQATLASKYDIQSYLSKCQIAGDYHIVDLAQLNTQKIKDEAIKGALQSQNIDNLTILSYENNQQIGFKACLR